MSDSDQIKRMADLSGSGSGGTPPKYVVPIIRHDGNSGNFRKIGYNEHGEQEETPLDKPIKLTILKKRRTLSSFTTLESFFTNEYTTTNEAVSLFKNVNKTITFEGRDLPASLREEYQALRTHEIIYALFEGEVVKMEVKGGSLGNYYDYQKSLSDDERHSFQVVTEISSSKTKNAAGFGYYALTFNAGEDVKDLDTVEEKMKEVDSALRKMDDYFKQRDLSASGKRDTIPKEPKVEYPEEEINPDDIPF